MSESAQRQAWRAFDSADDAMTEIQFGPAQIRVARPTTNAWSALETVLLAHDYKIREKDTHGYFPRNVAGTSTRSLHALGIAIDVNATTNPVKQTPNRPRVWFSLKPTQTDRAQDVLLNVADTDMTPGMIEDVRAIKTHDGKSVFGWGGDWIKKKDPMHFHINVTPQELAVGIDPATVEGSGLDLDGGTEADSHDVEMDPRRSADEILWGEDTMFNESEVSRFRPFLDFIANCEGTARQSNDGYDTSLEYGRYTGGEKVLTAMTLDQIDSLQTGMRRLSPSSALGRYQIVQTTLRGLKEQFGLSGDQLYSRELQDSLAVALIKRRGRDVAGLRQEWESLKKFNGSEILSKYDERPSGPIVFVPPGRVPPENLTFERLMEMLAQYSGGFYPNRQFSQSSQLVLKPGDRGPDVKALQEALSARKYQVGKIDGVYGTLTTAAVAAFQVDYKVPADVSGSVDGITWSMLREAPGRPLSEDRLNTTADDLRKMDSRIVADADNTRLMAVITSLLGVFGIGNFALKEYGASSEAGQTPNPPTGPTAAVDQQIAHAVTGFRDTDLKTFFGLNSQQTNTASIKIRQLEGVYAGSVPPSDTTNSGTLQDFNNPLLQLISAGANILLPGAGGSLAVLALGVASHFFGSRIIRRRVEDQRNGSNIGPHVDRR